jgi:[phosphatase 2A protein]-leucine-carboxy methyltransferase
MLDELEELDLVLQHYAITWGVKYDANNITVSQWSRWGLDPASRSKDEE